MTFKEFIGKYGAAIVGIVALLAGASVTEITDTFKNYEHLSLISGVGAFLTLIISYLLFQVQCLPSMAKRLGEHSEELEELAKGYGRMMALNEQAAKDRERMIALFEKMEASMEKLTEREGDTRQRVSRLEGAANGRK